jgi:hypothetical protein
MMVMLVIPARQVHLLACHVAVGTVNDSLASDSASIAATLMISSMSLWSTAIGL